MMPNFDTDEIQEINYIFRIKDKIPKQWSIKKFDNFANERKEILQDKKNPLILSITKHDGFVESLEYFKKQVFSKNQSKYKLVQKGDFAYSPIHIDEGSVALLEKYEEGYVSPLYTIFQVIDSEINKKFLHYLMKSQIINQKIIILNTLQQMKNLVQGWLIKLSIMTMMIIIQIVMK